MAVPNTNTFSLQDVVDEVNPTTDDLVDCFADAVASKFDPAYSGSKNQLLNFRNYGAETLTLFKIDNSYSYIDSFSACAWGSSTVTRDLWHNGSGANPSIGDTIYQDSSGNYTMSPANWYYIPIGNLTIQINSSGVVTSKVTC